MSFTLRGVREKTNFDPNVLPSEMLALSQAPQSEGGSEITAGEVQKMVTLLRHYDRYDRLHLLSQEQRAREFVAIEKIRRMDPGEDPTGEMSSKVNFAIAGSGVWERLTVMLLWIVLWKLCSIEDKLGSIADKK